MIYRDVPRVESSCTAVMLNLTTCSVDVHRYPALWNELPGILPVTTRREWRKMVENEFAQLETYRMEILFKIEWKKIFLQIS